MHFFKNSNSSSSSSSSPKSTPSSPSKQNRVFREISHLWIRRESSSPSSSSSDRRRLPQQQQQQQPRLTRQRKLRHVSDIEIGAPSSFDGRHRLSVSANSTPLSQSPSPQRERSSERWILPVPLPQPRPEAFLRRGESALSSSTGSSSGQFPLPSPKEVAGRTEGEEIDGAEAGIGDGTGDRASTSSAVTR